MTLVMEKPQFNFHEWKFYPITLAKRIGLEGPNLFHIVTTTTAETTCDELLPEINKHNHIHVKCCVLKFRPQQKETLPRNDNSAPPQARGKVG